MTSIVNENLTSMLSGAKFKCVGTTIIIRVTKIVCLKTFEAYCLKDSHEAEFRFLCFPLGWLHDRHPNAKVTQAGTSKEAPSTTHCSFSS